MNEKTTPGPEEQEMAAALDKIPATFMTESLRRSGVESARRAADIRLVDQELVDCRTARNAALEAHDVPGALDAELEVVAAERLAQMMPVTGFDPAAVDEALAHAAEVLAEAQASMPALPLLAYSLETACYRGFLPNIARDPSIAPPVARPEDLAAEISLKSSWDARNAVLATLQSWGDSGATVLDRLSAAASLVDQVALHRADTEQVVDQVEQANRSRAEAAIAWRVPHALENFTSQARKELESFRRSQVTPELVAS